MAAGEHGEVRLTPPAQLKTLELLFSKPSIYLKKKWLLLSITFSPHLHVLLRGIVLKTFAQSALMLKVKF